MLKKMNSLHGKTYWFNYEEAITRYCNAPICKQRFTTAHFKKFIHQHCWTPFSLLLLGMGVLWQDWNNKLQKLQNRAARIIASSKFDTPCKPRLLKLGLSPFKRSLIPIQTLWYLSRLTVSLQVTFLIYSLKIHITPLNS